MGKKHKYDDTMKSGAIPVNSPFYLFMIAQKGIDTDTFSEIVSKSPFTLEETARYLHISVKTINRRIQEKQFFSTAESEKVLQILQVTNKGLEVFEDDKKFKKWLERENISLGNKKPKELLENTFGVQMLLDELGRIEHGIFA